MDTNSWRTDDILAATGGELLSGEKAHSFGGISIDSRNISKNDLFVAIKGKRHDGHQFIADVILKGVRGIVMDRRQADQQSKADRMQQDVCCIAVNDTIRAFGDMAAYHIKRFTCPVVAITGSNGKTTTREMVASVIGRKFKTLSTFGNLNNDIGMPLTIFRMNDSHEAAVLELGMNHSGEIRRLGQICQPDFGLITNIGPAHLEGLGTIEDVMAAKGELIENIKDDGTIVLNGDDTYSLRLGAATGRKILYFGKSINADIRAVDISKKGIGSVFTLELPRESVSIELVVPGQFMVENALAAASVGYLLGCSGEEIKTGLEAFTPIQGRMNFIRTKQGIFLLDDTYNANPGSMEAAIKTLASLKGEKKGVLVAGDMLELGKDVAFLHEKMGRIAAQSGVTKLYLTGEYADSVKKGARDQGMAETNIIKGKKDELLKSLIDFLEPGDWVLVKGSRGSGMEMVVQQLEMADETA